MKYKYNADLELQHVALGDRRASYYYKEDKNHNFEAATLLIDDGGDDIHSRYVVASFDDYGNCNNASTFRTQEEAFKFFHELIDYHQTEEYTEWYKSIVEAREARMELAKMKTARN